MRLNRQQKAVVDWIREGQGSLNLVARAGCGKTFTLIRGAVRTIVENDLGTIALMAFNKSAAEEFKGRLAALAEETGNRRFLSAKVNPGTVHSFGFAAVRNWTKGKVKVDRHKCEEIVNRLSSHSDDIYSIESGNILRLVSLAKQSAFVGGETRDSWISLAEHHGINSEFDLSDLVRAAREVLRVSIQQDSKVIDFDDMIFAPLVHGLHVWTYNWVLIDEAQDTNEARRALALRMLAPGGRLIAVGDDRQAIYGFTGADSNSMELIRREMGSKVLPLSITYRCPKAVVKEANRLVPDLKAHNTAPRGSVRAIPSLIAKVAVFETDGKGRTIEEAEEREWDGENSLRPWFLEEKLTPEDAILCRLTRPLVETAYSMIRNGIGCRIEGRDIGTGLIKLATKWKTIKSLSALSERLEEYRAREIEKWERKNQGYRAQSVVDAVEALQVMIDHCISQNPGNGIQDLVNFIQSLFGDTEPGEIPNVVTLSTIHKAKGREWDRVFFLARSTTIPSPWAKKDWELQQEENLEYVAITRAKNELIYVD